MVSGDLCGLTSLTQSQEVNSLNDNQQFYQTRSKRNRIYAHSYHTNTFRAMRDDRKVLERGDLMDEESKERD